MIILLVPFYIIALYLGVKKPTQYVIYYILASTKFLGFIDPSAFIIAGIEIGYFGLNLITLFSMMLRAEWYKFPKKITPLLILFLLMLVYGLLKPVFDSNSNIIQAIIASKEIWYYSIFFYLFSCRNILDKSLIMNAIKHIGVYLAFVYVIGAIVPAIMPPFYYNGLHVRTFFPTYISLALLFYSIKLKYDNEKLLRDRMFAAILILGLCLARHMSLAIMTILGFILYKYVYNKNLVLQKYSVLAILMVSFFVTIFSVIFVQDLYYEVINTIDGIVTGEDGALSSRDIYNEFRWNAIKRKKELGYGFIHKSSDIMRIVGADQTNRFMESLGVVDSGFVDMLVKYGYIGTIIILVVYVGYSITGFLRKNINPMSVVMSIFLIQYLFINYTWSVYTFSHGIIPGSVAFFLMFESIDDMHSNPLSTNIIN